MNRAPHVPPHKALHLARTTTGLHGTNFPAAETFVPCIDSFLSLFFFFSLSEAKSFGVNRVQLFKVHFLLLATADLHSSTCTCPASLGVDAVVFCFSVSTSIPSAARPEYRHRHQSRGTFAAQQGPPLQPSGRLSKFFQRTRQGIQGQLARGSSPIGWRRPKQAPLQNSFSLED